MRVDNLFKNGGFCKNLVLVVVGESLGLELAKYLLCFRLPRLLSFYTCNLLVA